MGFDSFQSAIIGALGTLKQATDLVDALKSAGDANSIRAIQSELLARIIETQTGMLEAQGLMNEADRYIRSLENQIETFTQWTREAERYRLAEPFPGTFVYALRAESSNGDPVHYLCPACFERREKSILQGLGPGSCTGHCVKCDVPFVLTAPPHTPPRFFSGGY